VLGANNIATGSGSYDGYIPSANIQYSFTPKVMAYARFDKGFLAGIPLEIASSGIPASSLKSEHVNSYEVGFKSQWFDGHVRSNIDVFRSDYRDLQVTSGVFNPQGALIDVLSNASRTRSQGVEWDGEWVTGRYFRISLNTTYLDSKFVGYPNVTETQLQTFCHTKTNLGDTGCIVAFGGNGDPGALQDLSGKPTGFAPRWSGSLTGTLTADLPRAFHFTGDLSAYYSTWYYDANVGTDDPLLTQSGYIRLDLRLSLETPGRGWGVDIIGKNLTSRLITQGGTGATALPTSLGSLVVQEQAPRNVAAQVRYRF
jgi:outer membrane receptor protein involved in Fe transport